MQKLSENSGHWFLFGKAVIQPGTVFPGQIFSCEYSTLEIYLHFIKAHTTQMLIRV